MLTLKSKFLEARELPASDPYPPAALISVLAGTDTLHLFARHDLLERLAGTQPLEEITLELRHRRIDLADVSNGGTKGKAYRLTVVAVVSAGKASK